jgi:hypothetical protein
MYSSINQLSVEFQKKAVKSKTFKINEFTALSDPKLILDYAHQHLDLLGQGSSRATFLLSSRYVLKVAINRAGVEQNNVEFKISHDPYVRDIIAKVHSSDNNGYWNIADLVRPFEGGLSSMDPFADTKYYKHEQKRQEEFNENSAIEWKGFNHLLTKEDPMKVYKQMKREKDPELKRSYEMANKVNYLMEHYGSDIADILRIDHWGKTPDGRVVILDYGLDNTVAQRYTEEEYNLGEDW